MGQPVKLSDALVMEARITGEAMQRSIAGQVEFWASLGMAMERIMTGGQIANLIQRTSMAELVERLKNANSSQGSAELQTYLETHKFPRFWAHPEQARMFIREEADGTKTVGRFEGREWVVAETGVAAHVDA